MNDAVSKTSPTGDEGWPRNIAQGNGDTQALQRIEEHLAAIREGLQQTTREWLTIAEAAERLRVSKDTVERLVAAGKLKAAEIATPKGRGMRQRLRIRREWVDNFLLSHVRLTSPPIEQRRRRPKRDTDVDFIG